MLVRQQRELLAVTSSTDRLKTELHAHVRMAMEEDEMRSAELRRRNDFLQRSKREAQEAEAQLASAYQAVTALEARLARERAASLAEIDGLEAEHRRRVDELTRAGGSSPPRRQRADAAAAELRAEIQRMESRASAIDRAIDAGAPTETREGRLHEESLALRAARAEAASLSAALRGAAMSAAPAPGLAGRAAELEALVPKLRCEEAELAGESLRLRSELAQLAARAGASRREEELLRAEVGERRVAATVACAGAAEGLSALGDAEPLEALEARERRLHELLGGL